MRIDLENVDNQGLLVSIDGELKGFIRVAEGETILERIEEVFTILKAEFTSEMMLAGLL